MNYYHKKQKLIFVVFPRIDKSTSFPGWIRLSRPYLYSGFKISTRPTGKSDLARDISFFHKVIFFNLAKILNYLKEVVATK